MSMAALFCMIPHQHAETCTAPLEASPMWALEWPRDHRRLAAMEVPQWPA